MSELLALDQKISLWLNSLTGQTVWLDWVFKIVSIGFVYFLPLVLIIFWFYGPKEKLTAIRVVSFGLIGWLGINNLIGTIWFRNRPFIRMIGTQEIIFHQPDKSFPSDHATLGFTLAVGLLLTGYNKLGWFLFVWTVVFSLSRVIVGVHFPLDIVAGLIVGGLMALAGDWLKKPFDRYVGRPIIRLAQLIKLS